MFEEAPSHSNEGGRLRCLPVDSQTGSMRRLAAAALIAVSPSALLGGAFAGERLAAGEAGAEAIAAEAAWIERVNALCRRQSAEVDRLPKWRTGDEYARYVQRSKAISQRYDHLVLTLRTPDRFEADVAQLQRLIPATYEVMDASVPAIRSGDRRRLAAAKARSNRLEAKAKPLLRRLELDDCL
jgi:hypothetical protein